MLQSRNDGVAQPTDAFSLVSKRSEEVTRESKDNVPMISRSPSSAETVVGQTFLYGVLIDGGKELATG